MEDATYQGLLDLQDSIGARQFFEGWLHYEWEVLQQKYYMEINSREAAKMDYIANHKTLGCCLGSLGV
jgi:hypothetical protein